MMNERIRELAEQANEAFYQQMGEGAERGTFYYDKFAEKFAELIVKECAAVQHKRFCEHGDVSWDILMEHFGVER